MSTTIYKENRKQIRKSMEVYVRVEATIDGEPMIFDFTNDDLLSVELNLRADLSPIDPSLPESEIEVHVYYEDDISDIVKKIADDQPLLYWAGYDGDYSPVRKFYISEPVTWANKELIFKAVDAVHFLDQEINNLYLGNVFFVDDIRRDINSDSTVYSNAFRMLSELFIAIIESCGITIEDEEELPDASSEGMLTGAQHQSYIESASARDILANMMNLLHQDYDSGYFDFDGFYLNYVDAGVPKFSWSKPSASWTIYEEECGDIQKHTARDIVKINASNKRVQAVSYRDFDVQGSSPGYLPRNVVEIGTAEITKDQGATLSLNYPASIAAIKLADETSFYMMWKMFVGIGGIQSTPVVFSGATSNRVTAGSIEAYDDDCWMPWDSALSDVWTEGISQGVIASTDTQATLPVFGNAFMLTSDPAEYSMPGTGTEESPNKTRWSGFIDAAMIGDRQVRVRLLPDKGFQSVLRRSGVTGSFTWKGDPRMQPRDVIEWHFIDGTIEERTIESINLKHEAGGTIAEITYRKGIV